MPSGLAGGWGQLYAGYLPFLVRTVPYDVAELTTYSQLAARRPSAPGVPGPLADMAMGAAHGRGAGSGLPVRVCAAGCGCRPRVGLAGARVRGAMACKRPAKGAQP